MSYFPRWQLKSVGSVAPDERLSWSSTIVMGFQHVIAMFGSTIMAPLLMGFDPNITILMSGIGTLIFFLIVGGRVPSYLGSSFSFIAVVISLHSSQLAFGGIVFCGALYALIGLVVMGIGTKWIEKLMPPIVTGSIVAIIGLNLAPIAVKNASLLTIFYVAVIAVFGRGMFQRLSILIGLMLAYVSYMIIQPIDFSTVAQAAWFALPSFSAPVFSWSVMPLFVPIALILVAENLGHIKAVSSMTGQNLDRYMGRAFLGDGLATMLSGGVGGAGVTTYAENIGVMAVTRIYSTLVFVVAALIAILLGFSPKFGALIQTIPAPVLAGVSVVVFGLIVVAGIKIWVENKIDFSDNRNLIVAAVTLIVGAGDFTLHLPGVDLGGIVTGTCCAIVLNALFKIEPRFLLKRYH